MHALKLGLGILRNFDYLLYATPKEREQPTKDENQSH